MQTLVLAVLVAAPLNVKVEESPKKLPAGLKATGALVALATFDDKDGSHVAYVEQAATKKGDLELRGFGYTKGSGWTKQWQASDFVRDCEFDKVLEYRAKSLAVTDLDDDGVAEVTFAYELTCTSDVSPRTLKVLMYEGATKYAMRGETVVDTGAGEKVGGTHALDTTNKDAPPVFVKHLEGRWAELTRP
ncbi:MAG: M949_RS01915 family surface polysaccharide biosynthesis protein [Myxococcota bacterium]|nr:hypothetical protein [Myxococcota bacterium]